jgi:hypothetical protein
VNTKYETFKIINNIYDPEACPTLQHAAYLSTRGHGNKLFKMHSVKNIRKYSFSCRIVDVWNSLPAHVIQAPSVNAFKNRLDRHWQHQDLITNYRAKIEFGNRSQ